MATDFYTSIKDDYLLFDNVETVTLTLSNGDTVSNVSAIFEPLPIRQMPSSAGAESFDSMGNGAIIILFASTMSGNVPDEGTGIAFSGGETWHIGKPPALFSARTRWRCTCVKDRG